jgi:ribosomal protein S6
MYKPHHKKHKQFKPTFPDDKYDSVQLVKGTEVEMEHTNNREIAKIIAKHHLAEYHDYYIELEKMEEMLKFRKRLRRHFSDQF